MWALAPFELPPDEPSCTVVAAVKYISDLEATSCSCGTTAVWTRFPFTTRRIYMESVVKARRYGKAQTIAYGAWFQQNWKSDAEG